MADNKGNPVKGDERLDREGSEELERKSRHQDENAPRLDVADEDVGQERIHQKGTGGYGAQEGTVPRSAPPVSDKGGRKE
ncbi:hypothetical protein [Hyalangium rubrum]|uniref:Uncharacterized protein n=1 Tax=Hyalangium rubrum TaxID=3103134 RepID=A0ABU5GYQ1_9BACT|nr:hypothetical protein [Hyalangium sp. s54d21]MDY7226325.1 hypothetical protein [Hyalangium sp. s54d21]